MANGAISWASQRQKTVTLSVGEAEYMELASTGRQAAWLKSFSGEIGFPIEGPIPLCSDNQAAIFLRVYKCRFHHHHHQLMTCDRTSSLYFIQNLMFCLFSLVTGKSCGGICSCLHSQYGTSYTSSE